MTMPSIPMTVFVLPGANCVLYPATQCVYCCCRANAQQPKLFVGMILILIFAEALALYGLIGKICSTQLLQSSLAYVTGLLPAEFSCYHDTSLILFVLLLQLVSFWLPRLASQRRHTL